MPTEPYYFENSSLIQSSNKKLYAFFYNHLTQSHCIKIFSKSTGALVRQLSLQKGVKHQCIKIDQFSRIVVLSTNQGLLQYYNSNGDFLFETKSEFFKNFKSLELADTNKFYYLENYTSLFIY